MYVYTKPYIDPMCGYMYLPAQSAVKALNLSMKELINERPKGAKEGWLMPPRICTIPENGLNQVYYTVMWRVSVRPHILQENKVMGPLTQVECLMDTDWALAWKHPSFDRREVSPLHGRLLLVVPVQSLLTRSRIFSCQRKVGYWEHFQVLSEVTLSRQQMSGPCWHERW